MKSKIALHYQCAIPGWATSNPVGLYAKVMECGTEDLFPGRRTIGRYYLDDAETNAMCARGAAGADQWWAKVRPWALARPWLYAICTPNEPQPIDNYEFAQALSAFLGRVADLAHADGMRVIGPEISEGNPGTNPEGIMAVLAPGMGKLDGYSYHAYGWTNFPDDWHALRYRKLRQWLLNAGAPDKPWFLTEGFFDGGAADPPEPKQPGKGWYTRCNGDWNTAMHALRDFDTALGQDPYVECLTIFTAAPNGQWMDFAIGEGEANSIRDYIASCGGSYCSDLPTPGVDLRTVLLQAGEDNQLIQFNPDAALQKAAFAAGYVVNSNEFDVTCSGVTYRAQRAERMDTGAVRIFFCRVPDWGNVQWVQR